MREEIFVAYNYQRMRKDRKCFEDGRKASQADKGKWHEWGDRAAVRMVYSIQEMVVEVEVGLAEPESCWI